MSFRLGVDIVEIERIKKAFTRWGNKFLNRVFTPLEQEYCLAKKGFYRHLAGRFSCKEAVIKALGRRVPWRDIEVVNSSTGSPSLRLYNRAITEAEGLKGKLFHISISHCKKFAVANALMEVDNENSIGR